MEGVSVREQMTAEMSQGGVYRWGGPVFGIPLHPVDYRGSFFTSGWNTGTTTDEDTGISLDIDTVIYSVICFPYRRGSQCKYGSII